MLFSAQLAQFQLSFLLLHFFKANASFSTFALPGVYAQNLRPNFFA
jgi:hypothetical protein